MGKNQSVSSWNPYRESGHPIHMAPWLRSNGNWEKWSDPNNGTCYYTNCVTKESTYERPVNYSDPALIDHDSMDDDWKSIVPIYDDRHRTDEVVAIGIKIKPKRKSQKTKPIVVKKISTRGNEKLDENAGG